MKSFATQPTCYPVYDERHSVEFPLAVRLAGGLKALP
jgi:hypothetical protein